MGEHTPTPWAVEEVRTSIGRCFKIGSPEMLSEASKKPTYLCVYDDHGIGDNIQKANAAFIVKAVNSHDALVAAAQKVLDGLHHRMDHAASVKAPVPVFDGLAELHCALASIKVPS